MDYLPPGIHTSLSVHSKWVKYLNVKVIVVNVLEEYMAKFVYYYFGVRKAFKTELWNSIVKKLHKRKKFCWVEITVNKVRRQMGKYLWLVLQSEFSYPSYKVLLGINKLKRKLVAKWAKYMNRQFTEKEIWIDGFWTNEYPSFLFILREMQQITLRYHFFTYQVNKNP